MLNEWVAIRQFYGSPQTQKSRAEKTGNHFVPISSQMSDAGWLLEAGDWDVCVLSDAWGWPKRHCLKQNQTIPITYFLTYCIFSACFKGSSLTVLIPIALFIPYSQSVLTPRGSVCFVSKLCLGALVCLARRLCPSCGLQSCEGYARRLLTIKTANSHILPLFWPCFAEWCFSFFLEVGGYLTPPFREL